MTYSEFGPFCLLPTLNAFMTSHLVALAAMSVIIPKQINKNEVEQIQRATIGFHIIMLASASNHTKFE